MPLIESIDPAAFNGAPRVDWFGAQSQQGDPADLSADAYQATGGVASVTVLRVGAGQTITVSTCAPAPGERCNLEAGTGLLLADNSNAAPIWLRFGGNGVRAVGAFMVPVQVPFGTPFTPQVWATGTLSGTPLNFRGFQGVTGDIWRHLGDSVAPFVGVAGSGGERIRELRFDAIHPTTLNFPTLGIGYLYCLV
jgi:hypothetical protein